MEMVSDSQNRKQADWARIIIASVAGAAAAVLLGFALSLLAAKFGLGILRPSGSTESNSNETLARAGINFLISHHVTIVGRGATTWLEINWPITLWAIIPAVSLVLGGYICSLIVGRKSGGFTVGAVVAIPYTAFLIIMSPYCTAVSKSVQMPNLPAKGVEFDFSILPNAVKLQTLPVDIITAGLVFGILFGGLGALGGIRSWVKLLFSPELPRSSWIRGALAALVFGYFTMSILAFGITAVTHQWSSADLIPTVTGNFYGIAHGASLKVIRSNTVSSQGGFSKGGSVEFESKNVLPTTTVIALGIIPAFWLLIGGRIAGARSGKSFFVNSVEMAGFYALCMVATSALFSFALSQMNTVGDAPVKTTILLSLAPTQVFIGSFAIALVFGTLGAFWSQLNAHS